MLATLVASQNWKKKKGKKFQWTMATQGLHTKNSFENIVIHTTRCLKQNVFGGAKFHQNEEKLRRYILSQDSQFLRKYHQIFKKKNN
jgi:hypothetical protein